MKVPRKKMTPHDAGNIVDAFQHGGMEQALEFGLVLGYKKSAIYNAVQMNGGIGAHWQHPTHPTKWNQQQIDAAVASIQVNPTLTLQEIVNDRINQGDPQISVATLERYLDYEVITFKQTTDQNQQRNSQAVKAQRTQYAQWFLGNQQMNFIYVDEFGFNLSTQRRFGRAPAGQRAIQITPANQGSNVSVVAAIQRGVGLVLFEEKEGSFDALRFEAFIQRLVAHYQQIQAQNICIVMDNCRIHRAPVLLPIIQGAGMSLQFLPPYSPMLNPIEEVIGDIKRDIRTLLSVALHGQVLAIQNLPRGQKAAARRNLLRQALQIAAAQVQAVRVDTHYAHTFAFIQPALAGQDV
jgi:transposase